MARRRPRRRPHRHDPRNGLGGGVFVEAQQGKALRPHPTPAKTDTPAGPKLPKGKRDISDNPLDGLGQL